MKFKSLKNVLTPATEKNGFFDFCKAKTEEKTHTTKPILPGNFVKFSKITKNKFEVK